MRGSRPNTWLSSRVDIPHDCFGGQKEAFHGTARKLTNFLGGQKEKFAQYRSQVELPMVPRLTILLPAETTPRVCGNLRKCTLLLSRFLRMCPGLSRQLIGDLLGENNERCLRVLECFTASFDFTGLPSRLIGRHGDCAQWILYRISTAAAVKV